MSYIGCHMLLGSIQHAACKALHGMVPGYLSDDLSSIMSGKRGLLMFPGVRECPWWAQVESFPSWHLCSGLPFPQRLHWA